MRVQVLAPGQAPQRSPAASGFPEVYAGWRPRAVLGAASAGALLLPDAGPSASTMYAPRGVLVTDDLVIAADTGNHRILIWHGIPSTDATPADVVLGQPDEHTEGPGLLHLPTGLLLHEGRLVVCDAWHHRLLVWDSLPEATGTPPSAVIGAEGPPSASTLNQPFGIALVEGRCYVADTYNRRVLVWRGGVPEPGQPADVVLGQPDPSSRGENRDHEPAADSFRWPHAICSDGEGGVWIADAGNHRILGWTSHPDEDRPADRVLGQPDFTTAGEFPYVSQEGRLRFPYGIASMAGALAVADTANNRILLQDAPVGTWAPTGALAQPTLAANGENRWEQVASDTLCWPYGLSWHRPSSAEPDVMAIADSGNNRVVLWERSFSTMAAR